MSFKRINLNKSPINRSMIERYTSNPEGLYSEAPNSFPISEYSNFSTRNGEHARTRQIITVQKNINVNLAQEGIISIFSNNLELLKPFGTNTKMEVLVPSEIRSLAGENQLTTLTNLPAGYIEGVRELGYWDKDIRQAFGYDFEAVAVANNDDALNPLEEVSRQIAVDTPTINLNTDREVFYQLKRFTEPLKYSKGEDGTGSLYETIKTIGTDLKAYNTPFSTSKHAPTNMVFMTNKTFRKFVDEFFAKTGFSSSAAYMDHKVETWNNSPTKFDTFSFLDVAIMPLYQDGMLKDGEVLVVDVNNALIFSPFIPKDYMKALIDIMLDPFNPGITLMRRGGRMILENAYSNFNTGNGYEMKNKSPFVFLFSQDATSDLTVEEQIDKTNKMFYTGYALSEDIVDSDFVETQVEETKKSSKK